jgi:hypothetical protein
MHTNEACITWQQRATAQQTPAAGKQAAAGSTLTIMSLMSCHACNVLTCSMEVQANRLREDVAYEQELRRQLADQLEEANKVTRENQPPLMTV